MTLYQESARTATSIMEPKADSTHFLGLTPGTKYKVEVISWAGPLYTAAPNISAWTCEWGVKCTGGGDPWAVTILSSTPKTLDEVSQPQHCARHPQD